MLYDDTLSSEVSLSRILDELIESGSSSEVIVCFLQKYDAGFKDIAAKSMCIDRLYCSDYLTKCKKEDAEYLLSHVDDIDQRIVLFCAWQCFYLENAYPEFKWLAKPLHRFMRLPENDRIGHPHACFGYNVIKTVDADFIMNGFCPELAFDAFSYEDLTTFIKGGVHSIFAVRLFQLDCFMACDDLRKHIILKNLKSLLPFIAYKFVRQLLTADVSADMKFEVLKQDILKTFIGPYTRSGFEIDDELRTMLDSATSYSSIAIYMTLQGEDCVADSIFYLLATKKYKVLAEMAEDDSELIEKNFNIKGLIEYIKSNTVLADAQKHGEKHAA